MNSLGDVCDGWFCFVGIHGGCRCSGMLRSILSSAIAPHTFLRESPLTKIVSSSAAVGRRGFIDANSSPGSPLQSKGRAVRLAGDGQHPRFRASWTLREGSPITDAAMRIEQPGESLVMVSWVKWKSGQSGFRRPESPALGIPSTFVVDGASAR
jgi:hypothetical protein